MTKVKFRAWDKRHKRMIEVTSISFRDGTIQEDTRYAVNRKIYLDDVVLMQDTGLKDKKGVEIYEGDIVRWKKEFISPMDMRTKHKIDGNRKVYQKESGEWVMGQGNGLHSEVKNIEVIGNIYEDQELLEEI